MSTQAKQWYEHTRGLSAFNVVGYHHRYKNQHATIYVFPDRSEFIVYRDFGKAYRVNNYIMARRTSFEDNLPG